MRQTKQNEHVMDVYGKIVINDFKNISKKMPEPWDPALVKHASVFVVSAS